MRKKSTRLVFWALIAVFVVAVVAFLSPLSRLFARPGFPVYMPVAGVAVMGLGGALIFLTLKEGVKGLTKKFLLLTGASAAGVPVFVLLHNAVFALFIQIFGEDFWQRVGIEDEPFFFMLATTVSPLGFIVGTIGSIVQMRRGRRKSQLSNEQPGDSGTAA